MSEASTRRRKQAGLTAIAIGLSLGVNADDHDVRIGRYQTVTVEAPLQEVELKPMLRSSSQRKVSAGMPATTLLRRAWML